MYRGRDRWPCLQSLARQPSQCTARKQPQFLPEGTKRATSVNVQLPCLRKDLRAGSISRDVVNFPSELCRRRGGTFAEVARLVPPDKRFLGFSTMPRRPAPLPVSNLRKPPGVYGSMYSRNPVFQFPLIQ